MRITEGKLRKIIREELNEMSMNPHAVALKARIGGFKAMSDAAYNEAVSLAIEEGDLNARTWQRALNLKRGNIAMAFEEVLSMLDEETAGKIQQNYDNALEAKQAEAESAGELEDYYEDEPKGEETERDPEDPYGGLPKGSRIPGRGSVHTAGFKPGEKKRLFGID